MSLQFLASQATQAATSTAQPSGGRTGSLETEPESLSLPHSTPVDSHNGLDPSGAPSDAIADARCRSVENFTSAGTALFRMAAGRARIDRSLVERVVLALEDVGPMVRVYGNEILDNLNTNAVPGLMETLKGGASVDVYSLGKVISTNSSQITQLMMVLRFLCPSALAADQVDNVMRTPLGQTLS